MTFLARSFWLALGFISATLPARAVQPPVAAPAQAQTSANRVPLGATAREIQIGRDAARDIERAIENSPRAHLLRADAGPDAAATLEKLERITSKLGRVSDRPAIEYRTQVIETPQVNAFTLPNGQIYVFRGLLKAVASEDELAAVIAHEIGHNTKMHALRARSRANRMSWVSLATMLAAIAGGRDGANIASFSQYALAGIMNGYSVEFEKEADADAIEILYRAGYNPSALVTFMRRLELEETRRPEVDLGIFRTHPAPRERVEAALAELRSRGIAFDARAVGGAGDIQVETSDGAWRLTLRGLTLIDFDGAADNPAARERADRIAADVAAALLEGGRAHELRSDADGSLWLRGRLLARATPEDAGPSRTPAELAASWRANFERLFWREQLNGRL